MLCIIYPVQKNSKREGNILPFLYMRNLRLIGKEAHVDVNPVWPLYHRTPEKNLSFLKAARYRAGKGRRTSCQ